MIIDLHNTDPARCHADVAIIGGGIAGLLLATRLAAAKLNVAVLESGGLHSEAGVDNAVIQIGKHHVGALTGRERCLGGTSIRWGGKMIPFLPHDLAARTHLALPSWPLQYGDLIRHLPEVERQFKLQPGSYEGEEEIASRELGIVKRYEKLPTFRRRNVRALLRDKLEDPALNIFINAAVTDFTFADGRIVAVKATGLHGKPLSVHARQFVIAAGAIESTRLLLDMNRRHGVFADCEVLGGYFFDHLFATVAEFQAADGRALNRFAAHRFVGSSLRGSRLETTACAQAKDRVASAYGQIDFQRATESGFENARDLLRALQGQTRVSPVLLANLVAEVPYLANALYWRYRHQQVLWPSPVTYVLRVIAEQLPMRESRIGLAGRRDRFGVPLASIDWKLSDIDRETFRAYARRFEVFWNSTGMHRIGQIVWSRNLFDDQALDAAIGDFYHPGGSTRMGRTRRSAVVDKDLRTFAIANLWIASTSVFPSGASANPTLMLMLLTFRLAEALICEEQKSPQVLVACRSAAHDAGMGRLSGRVGAGTTVQDAVRLQPHDDRTTIQRGVGSDS